MKKFYLLLLVFFTILIISGCGEEEVKIEEKPEVELKTEEKEDKRERINAKETVTYKEGETALDKIYVTREQDGKTYGGYIFSEKETMSSAGKRRVEYEGKIPTPPDEEEIEE